MKLRQRTLCVLLLLATACTSDDEPLGDAGGSTGDAAVIAARDAQAAPGDSGAWGFDGALSGDGSAAIPGTPDAAAGDAGTDAATGTYLASCLPSATLKPGKASFSLTRDGTMRAVNVYVPSDYDGKKPLPLVVDFHGLHEGAGLHEAVSNWDDTVDANQYIVAMPQGIQNSWNVGPCCTESRSVDDVAFARELVAKIAADGCIDTRRIYATGYSNGGGMTMKVACDAADLFAAAAPAAFDLLEESRCTPSRPISVFDFRGTSDPIVPYEGGASTPPTLYPLTEIHFLGAAKTFAKWGELNACTGTPTDTGSGCQTYTQCAGGVKVTLCTTTSGGHDPSDAARAWPMLKEYTLP